MLFLRPKMRRRVFISRPLGQKNPLAAALAETNPSRCFQQRGHFFPNVNFFRGRHPRSFCFWVERVRISLLAAPAFF
jgi:hypothetical protein